MSIPKITPHVTSRSIGDEVFIMHLETKVTYSLNETAARTWSLIDGVVSMDEIAVVISEEYEVDEEECKTAVSSIIDELLSEKLLTI